MQDKCRNCVYSFVAGGWRKTGSYVYCQYILIEGHRRPCKGGWNCTVFKPRRQKSTKAEGDENDN